MKETLNELITLISTGCMGAEEIRRIADEAAQACRSGRVPRRQRTSTTTTASRSRSASGWWSVACRISCCSRPTPMPSCSPGSSPPSAGRGVQHQAEAVAQDRAAGRPQPYPGATEQHVSGKGGYVLVDFSEPLDDELQAVLVYTRTCRGSWRSASRPASMPRLPTKSLRDAEAE